MKKQLAVIIALPVLLVIGCPTWESKGSVTNIRVFLNGTETGTGLNIEQGQTVTLHADTGIEPEFISIAWENEESIVEIINTGEGPECVIKGMETGATAITVKAWRSGEKPAIIAIPVIVSDAVVRDIIISDTMIGAGEKRILAAQIIPAWAAHIGIDWSADSGNVILEETGNIWTIEGVTAGSVTLNAAAQDNGAYTGAIQFTVYQPDSLSGLEIFFDGIKVSGTTEAVGIGVFEEKLLSIMTVPASALTFYSWESSDPAVTVDSNGVIKGMKADSNAVITVTASGLRASVAVKVANPVSGVRIKYDNSDELPVSNIIWLYPEDLVNLKADLMPDGIEGAIYWTGGSGAVQLDQSLDGKTCTIKGILSDTFDTPPVIIRVSAQNSDNGTKPAAAVLQIKVMDQPPIWAWDRARDADANQALKQYGEEPAKTSGSWEAAHGIPGYASGDTYNTEWNLEGRGIMAQKIFEQNQITIKRVKVPYTPSGLNMCSVPNAPSQGANSTILVIGSNSNENTLGITQDMPGGYHVPGIFDFTTEEVIMGGIPVTRPISKPIRVSVDFEVISANGRQLAICVNNTDTQFLASPFGNTCRLAYRIINEAKGSKITYSTYLDAPGFLDRDVPGKETLSSALIAIALMSNGGNIYLSGIRIEYGE